MNLSKKWIVLVAVICFISCQDDEGYVDITTTSEDDQTVLSEILNLPTTSFNYANVILPNFFLNNQLQNEDNTPINNEITDNGATLGRVLFYDKKLSLNNTTACASCHFQGNSFADSRQFSVGFEGGLTGRNSPNLANAKFYENGRFFWDERAATLEDQVLGPIQDHVEMGMDLDDLVIKLEAEDYYKVLFSNAFGNDDITSDKISLTLAQFVRSMVSYESKYDNGLSQNNNPNTPFNNFTASENRGKQLFFSNQTRCSQCHITNAFVSDRPRNIGLDLVTIDEGVGGVTENNNQIGEFKVASLRNVQLTAPYMHDGRFSTLTEVVQHYNVGVQNNANLDNRLRVNGGGVRRLNLSNQDVQALVDFLNTLTDTNFTTDQKFSDPFISN